MKTQIFTLMAILLLATPMVKAKEIVITVTGTLKAMSHEEYPSEGQHVDSYTCIQNAQKTCYTITIQVPDGRSIGGQTVPYVTNDILQKGDVIIINAEGRSPVVGSFISYKNLVVLGENFLTREHKFVTETLNK
jgi:hypothetical protein